MKIRFILTSILFATASSAFAQQAERDFAFENYRRYYQEAAEYNQDSNKLEAVKKMRDYFHNHPYRLQPTSNLEQVQNFLKQLGEDGTFADMNPTERDFEKNNAYQKGFENTTDDVVGIFIASAYERLFQIASAIRLGKIADDEALSEKIQKAILHYGEIEVRRPNNKPRFHASCFAIPTAAVNLYFALLDKMDQAERGEATPLLTEACDMLKAVGLEAWTQPLRNDETDKNVVSIERFRNHVWWVGGNALGYRSLLPVAAMYSSVPMIDLLAEICQKGISMTSQTTYNESFWTEGFTADGAGWGHGMQCLIWGYPIDGTFNALNMLTMLNGTPWAKQLTRTNAEALMNFFRGGNWYYYKGFRLPGLDRNSYVYNPTEKPIPYKKLLANVVSNWISSFTPEEQAELKQLQKEAGENRINMQGYDNGMYTGVRWFYNNDDLMKKTPDYHICINMASRRTDGLESAAFADNYNFYPTDGATLFQRDGDEYFRVMGGWDVTAMPGVTAREGMDKLVPVTNWRGYCSKYNFAAGATDSGENGVAGYIFEKMHGADKENVNDKGDRNVENSLLYGFKAYKGYFILGDYFVALGAGVTNMNPDEEGHIRTTLDQTALTGEVFITRNGKKEVLGKGETTLEGNKKKAIWLTQQGKFSYCILPEYTSKAFVACETRPTNWLKLNPSNKKTANLPEQVQILRIWADHGQQPVNDTYGYAVYTGQGVPSERLPFEVLQNDTLVQAMRTNDRSVTQAVFYPGNKGLKAKGISLQTSVPCAVMIQQKDGKQTISVTDAAMDANLKEITVTLNGKAHRIALPQGLHCGNTVTVEIAG